MAKMILSILWFLFRPLLNERGEVELAGGGGSGDTGGATDAPVGNEGGGESFNPDTGDQHQEPTQQDWRVKKYGDNWEQSVDYWRDNSQYAWGQYKTERTKRQAKAPLEDFNGGGQQQQKPNGKTEQGAQTKTEFQDVQELLDHVQKQNKEFFESSFEQKLSEREKESNFKSSMRKARSEISGDTENGMPSFADLEQEVLIPLVEKNPKVLTLLRELEGDPGQNAYTLGMLLKFQDGIFDILRGQGREQFAKKIDDVSKQAVRLRAGKPGNVSVKTTPDDIWKMSKDEFEQHVAKQTGRS